MADFTKLRRNTHALTIILLGALVSACGGGDEETSSTDNGLGVVVLGSTNQNNSGNSETGSTTVQGVSSTSPVTISGSVVDGPVIGAAITITDASGRQIATTTSNLAANYSATIPAGTLFPLAITATGGTDLVTNTPPSFSMVSTVLSAADTTANINPFTTLIVKTAYRMSGGLTPANLEASNHNILTVFNSGLDRSTVPNPITTPITEQNVATIVKASEVFAEIIRRNFLVVSGVETDITQNALIESLAADMTDGVLDGTGTKGTDILVSSSISVVSGQVLIEALSNNLQVNDVPVTGLLDDAIKTIIPSANQSTGELPINTDMLLNTQTAIAAAFLIAPSIALSDIQTTVNSIDSGATSMEVSTLLLADASDTLDPAIITVASSTESQMSVLTSVANPVNGNSQAPFSGTPWAIPGKIEAENYDVGGAGIAYSDNTIEAVVNNYRNDNVDIYPSTDVGGGYMVGVTDAGEWLEYTVNVAAAGTYTINLRAVTAKAGKQVRVLMGGIDVTGAVAVPSTGDWQNWQTISKTVNLSAGQQVLRLQIDSGSVNINSIEILAGDSATHIPFGGTPWAIPGKIEAENYDVGGAGIAYSDNTIEAVVNNYRNDNVDIYPSTDVGGGYMVGVTDAGEWLEYTVNVASAGTYTINLRAVTAKAGKQVRVLMGGIDVTGAVAVPSTGDWQNWQTISKTVNLSAGQQVLRLQIDSGSVNINSIEILAGDSATTTPPPDIANTKLTVSWNPNPESVDGYIVYFGPSEAAVTNETSNITAFAGSFDPANPAIQYDSWYDLRLLPGDNVCFKLRAYNADGLSGWSLPACTTVPQAI